jgi:excisionase family DNA binding protein
VTAPETSHAESGTSPPYLTPQDVADLLKVNARTVLRLAATDASFPAVRVSPKVIRVERAALERWLARKLPRAAQAQRKPHLLPRNTAP